MVKYQDICCVSRYRYYLRVILPCWNVGGVGWNFFPQLCGKELNSWKPITVLTVWIKHVKIQIYIKYIYLFPSPLSQSVRLYFLGKEAMEQEEEDSLATGNACGCPCWHCTHRRHRYPCHDYWHPCVCGKEGEALETHSHTCSLEHIQVWHGHIWICHCWDLLFKNVAVMSCMDYYEDTGFPFQSHI